MTSIPFTTPSRFDVQSGYIEGRGAIYVDDEEVVIEVRVRALPLFRSTTQTFRFDLTDLEEVQHRRGPFRDRLVLRTRPMDHAARVPGSANGVLTVHMRRRHRRAIDRLLNRLDLWLT